MSDYTPTVMDMRMAMINRGFTEAQVSELLGRIKAAVWDEAISEAAEQGTIQTPPNPYKEMP